MPASNKSWMAYRISSSCPGGILRHGSLNGCSRFKWISCSTPLAHPRSFSLLAKGQIFLSPQLSALLSTLSPCICFTDTHLQLGENNFPMGRVISFRLKPSTTYTVVARWTLARAGLRGSVTRSFNMLVVSIGTKRLLHPEFNVTSPGVTDI